MNIAELVVTTEPVVICTVLGSCVSVCLFTENHYAGGMIHYALPLLPKNSDETPLRYGDYAITTLITELAKLAGCPPSSLVAKIIGGADNIASEHASQKVGTANVKIARKLLFDSGIRVIGEDVGGDLGRKVLFHIKTGRLQSAFVGPGFCRPSAEKAIQLPVRSINEATNAVAAATTTIAATKTKNSGNPAKKESSHRR